MKAKKLLSYVLCVVLCALAFTGCGSQKTQSASASKEVVSSAKTTSSAVSSASKSTQASEKTQTVTDSIGRKVEIPSPVTSCVVANAYNTEIINAIGALNCVVGVDYNIYQDKDSWKNKFTEDMVIGKSQKDLNYEKIIALKPQVLILTGNGTYEEAQKQLEPFGIKVVVCDAYYTNEFAQNCALLGQVFGKEAEAKELSDYFTEKLDYIKEQLKDVPKKTLYFEYRTEGNTTIPGNFFYDMVEDSGADNIFRDAKNVKIDPEAVVEKNPQYIVKVSAPDVYSSYYPPTSDDMKKIKDDIVSRPGWDEIDAVKNDNILLLSHYVHGGASKLVGTMYIAKFLYPDKLPDLHPEQVFKDWLVKYQKLDYIEGHTSPAYTFED